MTIRITGMNSGLDTEAIITELASARSVKVQKIEKEQTKLSWKIDAWKELNAKIYDFYSEVLSDMRFDYAYTKKKTTVSDPDAVTVQTAGDAMNGVQTLKVNEVAQTGYLTGAKIDASSTDKLLANLEGLEWLKDENQSVTFKVTVGGEEKEIKLTGYNTINDVVEKFKEIGLDAKFDTNNGRFFIASKESGKAANFTIEPGVSKESPKEVPELQEVPKAWEDLTYAEQQLQAVNGIDEAKYNEKRDAAIAANKARQDIIDANNKLAEDKEASTKKFADLMKGLGMLTEEMAGQYGMAVTEADKAAGKFATKLEGRDAEIELNGAKFTSSKNVFEINGLTMSVHKKTTDAITLTTEQDTDQIYDTIKNFFVKYNELINEMDKLYNAESASKYEPLTKEEKEALSDTEVEEWEKKIKESLLRRDSTLSSVSSAMKDVFLTTFISDINGRNNGNDKYLSYFGIETLGYFKAKDNEKYAYHIDGNADDSNVKNNEDKLRAAIANEPETVIEFFKKLSNNLYDTLTEKMDRSDYSSAFTVYNDKLLDTQLKSYESKISKEQEKLNDYIDRWYEKFSQMEVALSKLNSKESSLSSLFG
ncbi:MAG: flagellar filament capping protein FliD [Lachnospiraceae bacterium]|nr:flagellar filament capping protein FliD [Lachnospiraceae bacterium]